MAKPKLPRNGRCPHCERVKPVLNRGYPEPTMDRHNYREPPPEGSPKGTRGKIVPCPGSGKAAQKGTAK